MLLANVVNQKFAECAPLKTTSLLFPPEIAWKPWDTAWPALPDGFKAGVHKDGTAIYVGRALYRSQTFPGRINVNDAIYIVDSPIARIVSNIDYLSVSGDCNCRFEICETNESCLAKDGAIFTQDGNVPLLIPKFIIESDNPPEYDAIGIYAPSVGLGSAPTDDGGSENRRPPFNILVCNKTPEV